ncbi:MAG: hybrid sensor histidine kinase/response regulator transcription factor [Bifidobacteriaceae bacterium]|jgi:DNA-binding NarL/FixJ family response regulator/signal transduction histidine kinase|nr:hybrid sensor histidine kinase/response regulator transcription factor [Bifidobacteriaceae bacterium]
MAALPEAATMPDRLKAGARVWDAAVAVGLGICGSIALFLQRPPAVPVLVAVIIVLSHAVMGMAYRPRSEATYEAWERTGVWVFDALLVGVILTSGVFGYVDQPDARRGPDMPWQTAACLIAIVLAWLICARPLLPWEQPLPGWRWWPMAIVAALAMLGVGYVAPSAAIAQVAVYGMLWVSGSSSKLLARPAAGTVLVAAAAGIGLTLSRGWASALVIEICGVIYSLLIGMWLHSGWRWGAEKAYLLATLAETRASLAAAERESGVMVERERLAREIHDTIAQSLVGVLMAAERAQGRAAGPEVNDPLLADELSVVIESAREALKEARSLVAVSAKLEHSGPLDEALAQLAKRFTRETGIVVDASVDLPGALPPDLQLMLLRAAQEGLGNVRKHSGAAHAWVTAKAQEGQLVLEVVDDGVGLVEGPGGSAAGFGLAGLRERVAAVGGRVELCQADGGGARLTVQVSHAMEEPAPTPEPAGQAADQTSPAITVIVADDHPIVRKGLVDLLRDDAQFEVLGEAATGEEAVELARELGPDVVLMDLQMPGRGGVWATQQVLADAARLGRGTRTLAVTMFDSDVRIVEAMGAGADDYILKANPPPKIVEAVRRVAAGKPQPSAVVAAALANPGQPLTQREAEVLRLVARGMPNKEVAAKLFVAESTIKTHLSSIYAKLGVNDRTHAVTEAIARELI